MSASDIQRLIEAEHCVDVVLVAPYSVIHALVKLGTHPLYAVMDGPPPRTFIKFQRVEGYTFNLSDPKPLIRQEPPKIPEFVAFEDYPNN